MKDLNLTVSELSKAIIKARLELAIHRNKNTNQLGPLRQQLARKLTVNKNK